MLVVMLDVDPGVLAFLVVALLAVAEPDEYFSSSHKFQENITVVRSHCIQN